MKKLTILLAAVFVAVMAFAGTAGAVLPKKQEAENRPQTSYGLPVTDNGATPSGASPNAFRFNDPGTNNHIFGVDAGDTADTVTVRAKNHANSESGVTLQLVVDGVAKDTYTLGFANRGTYVERSWSVSLPAGQHTLGVRAGSLTGTDKLHYDWITINGTGTPPPTDTDGDGVTDDVDQCPDQPGPASNNGCPETPVGDWTWPATADINVQPGDDIDAKLNGAASGATVKVHTDGDGEYTYPQSGQISLRSGVKVYGEPGTLNRVGGASKGAQVDPTVAFSANFTNDQAMSFAGNNALVGVEAGGLTTSDPGSQNCAGKGMYLATGDSPNNLVQFSLFRNNPAVGIAGFRGKVLDSEFTNNTSATWAIGCNAGSVKSRFEFEAGRNFSHDERGNGIWTDNGTEDDPLAANDAWIHDNVTIRNDSAGIRIEETPDINPSSDPSQIAITVEGNISAANSQNNGRADIHVHDSANVDVLNNSVGAPQTISGIGTVTLGSGTNVALRASDSCRTDRPDLGDPTYGPVRLINNDVNGAIISVEESRFNAGDVILSGNTEVGTLKKEGDATGCG